MPSTLADLLIQHQNITNIRVGDFHDLKSLTRLRIWDSHVVNLQPGCFQSLPRLKELDLRRNSIVRLKAETFKGLEQLGTLNLDHNEIYHIDNAVFPGLKKLKSLSIKDNCLYIIPQGIESIAIRSVYLTKNPISSVGNVGALSHLSRLDLVYNKIRCDCGLREIKTWILENEKTLWTIPCMDGETGTFKLIEDVPWDDLMCASPDVSIIADNRTVTGNVSLTCQTDCQDGFKRKFSWISSNGNQRSSSYEFSKNYTHVSKLSCKWSNITRMEKKRMCYSVLNILPMGSGTEGTYTCKVTANHTQNASASAVYQDITEGQDNIAQPDNITTKPSGRSTRKYNPQPLTTARDAMVSADDNAFEKDTPNCAPTRLSTTELIFAGLASFCGVGIILAAITVCVYKFRGICQMDNVGRRNVVDGGPGNDAQCSGTGGATVSHYENDNQVSDTVSDEERASDGHYENDDQLSDGIGRVTYEGLHTQDSATSASPEMRHQGAFNQKFAISGKTVRFRLCRVSGRDPNRSDVGSRRRPIDRSTVTSCRK
uniref:Ig-like domain-containing protein n=1 Tax=Branchiostoma floridae TaxID=7739 RepID=C3YDE7_BRAFL|eukprot:XP_002605748.1 hypothetical protein BRAFLDRAFT_78015 [Branchiostoma floridae]